MPENDITSIFEKDFIQTIEKLSGQQEDIEEDMRNHWKNWNGPYEILKEQMGIEEEIFASPWNCSGVFERYRSRFFEDEIFGAKGSAWGKDWKRSKPWR